MSGYLVFLILVLKNFYFTYESIFPEIIERVKEGSFPLFRPSLEDASDSEVVTIMKKCWAEDPFERPEFTYLKNWIRKLNK